MSFVFTIVLSCSSFLWASPKLRLGSPAPRLADQVWVQGEPVETFRKGHVYVLDFWATTCAPCVETLPHLAELNRAYGDDVHFIGIAAEIDTVESVREFLAHVNPKLDFSISLDAKDSAWRDWLQASGAMGIPTAIVIDRDQRVAYIGSPTLLDRDDHGQPLARIVAGTWASSREYQTYATAHEERVDQTFKLRGIYQGLADARAKEDWSRALRTIELGLPVAKGFHETDLRLHKAELLTHRLGRGPEAAASLPAIVEEAWDNPQTLGRVLDLLVDENLGGGHWDFELGHRVALRILSLISFNPNLGYRQSLSDYRAMLLPPVTRFYFKAGLPALAAYHQAHALLSAEQANYDPSELLSDFDRYQEAARHAPTNWGEELCVDGRCYLRGPSAGERKLLDRLLVHNPASPAEAERLFEDGHVRVEVVAAPSYLVQIPGGPAESALFTVATNPLAPKLMRRASIATLGRLGAKSAQLFLRDVVDRALEDSHFEERSRHRDLLPEALDALTEIGDEDAPTLRERCAELLER